MESVELNKNYRRKTPISGLILTPIGFDPTDPSILVCRVLIDSHVGVLSYRLSDFLITFERMPDGEQTPRSGSKILSAGWLC
jgi:hypothetical protein